MGLGIRLRRLWHLRAGVIVVAVLAAVAAVWSVARISVLPPGITPRETEMASAVSRVLVDTPSSALLDLRQNTDGLASLTTRAVLLGNVMSTDPLRSRIAVRAGVPPELLEVAAPLTPAQPRPLPQDGRTPSVGDILRSTDQYRLDVAANPSVPLLQITAQTPSPGTASALANAAVDELRTYLAELARDDATPAASQIRLLQLGRAKGTVINKGVDLQIALLVFVLAFALGCATLTLLDRVIDGWKLEKHSESATAS